MNFKILNVANSRQLQAKKTMRSCSASSENPYSNLLDCIVFSCFVVYRG